MRRLIAFALASIFAAGACTGGTETSGTLVVGEQDFNLYTHCGIWQVTFEDETWKADPPLHDGDGNPPSGWGNPYQAGTMKVVSATELAFVGDGDQRARFVPLRPGEPTPGPDGCD